MRQSNLPLFAPKQPPRPGFLISQIVRLLLRQHQTSVCIGFGAGIRRKTAKSGLGIHFELVQYFKVWHEIANEGLTAVPKNLLRRRYVSTTAVLVLVCCSSPVSSR